MRKLRAQPQHAFLAGQSCRAEIELPLQAIKRKASLSARPTRETATTLKQLRTLSRSSTEIKRVFGAGIAGLGSNRELYLKCNFSVGLHQFGAFGLGNQA